MAQTIASLKKAVSGGVNKVIVDVRDNLGGDSNACLEILNALNMTPGEYGSIIRFSKPASEQRGYLRENGEITFKPINNAKQNKNIELFVAENENTFSSATILAAWIRPDITKTSQKELIPDIVVPVNNDALGVAIDSLKGNSAKNKIA